MELGWLKAFRRVGWNGVGCWKDLAGWMAKMAGPSGCLKHWRPDAVPRGGGIKYLFDCLHVRVCKNCHRSRLRHAKGNPETLDVM